MEEKKRKKIFLFFRIGVSIGLLAIVLSKVEIQKMVKIVKEAEHFQLLFSFFLLLVVVGMLAYRWQVLLSSKKIYIQYKRLLSYYFTGFFFSNFLPTAIGGDIVRAYYAGKDVSQKAEALASVLVERLLGSLSLFFIAIFTGGIVLRQKGDERFLYLVLGSCFGVLFCSGLFFNRKLIVSLDRILGSPSLFGMRMKLKNLYDSIHSYINHKWILFKVFLITIILQGVVIVANYFIGLSLGFNLSLVPYFLYIPIIGVVSVLPISINAWGLQEGSFVVLFSRAGLSGEEALTLSFVYHLMIVATSLIGGLTFLMKKERKIKNFT